MSQEKIDKRKAEKANRKKELAKRKKKKVLHIVIALISTIAFIAVVLLAAGQLGGAFEDKKEGETYTLSEEEMSRLMDSLQVETEPETDENGETIVSEEDTKAADDKTKETTAAKKEKETEADTEADTDAEPEADTKSAE